ncbi:hypothetical protein OB905_12715 [Halobacteria archaeon AArc-dxtr1]|nr:hypothetical protein [Halobacteria archaeon AArc-dxtr1]
MISRAYHATLFALYQLCILIGITAMPLAIAANRVGLSLPVHRLLANVGEAYESAQSR